MEEKINQKVAVLEAQKKEYYETHIRPIELRLTPLVLAWLEDPTDRLVVYLEEGETIIDISNAAKEVANRFSTDKYRMTVGWGHGVKSVSAQWCGLVKHKVYEQSVEFTLKPVAAKTANDARDALLERTNDL